MSRCNNTPPLPPPSYAEWVAKYRADGKRERELHIASIQRRRAAGLLTVCNPVSFAENAEWDAAEWAIDNDERLDGDDDNFSWGAQEL